MPNAKTAPVQPRTIVAIVENNPLVVFQDEKRFDDFLTAFKAEIAGTAVRSIDTAAGRQDIISLAFKCIKAKTALDAAGKKLTEDARDQIAKVDAARRRIRVELDALAEEVRAPVTNWEAQEAQRVQIVTATIQSLRNAGVILSSQTSEDVEKRLEGLKSVLLEETVFVDKYDEAKALLLSAHDALTAGHARLLQEEADRAELLRLREEARIRDAKEAQRLSDERQKKLDAQRIKDEAEAKKKREADAKVAEERRQKELKTAREQAAKDALQRAEAAAQQETVARQREADARAADVANRKRVLGEIEAAIEKNLFGFPKTHQKAIAERIASKLANGDIPHTKVTF